MFYLLSHPLPPNCFSSADVLNRVSSFSAQILQPFFPGGPPTKQRAGHTPTPPPPPRSRTGGQDRGTESHQPALQRENTRIATISGFFLFAAQLTFNGNIPSSSFLMENHLGHTHQETRKQNSLILYEAVPSKHPIVIMVTM